MTRRVIGYFMGMVPIVEEPTLPPDAWNLELVMPDPVAAKDVAGMRRYLDRMLGGFVLAMLAMETDDCRDRTRAEVLTQQESWRRWKGLR